MRRALFMGCVCWAGLSCASHRESAVQVDASLEKQTESHAAESLEIHRIEEPSRVTTTVAEFGPAEAAAAGAGGGQVLPASPAPNLSASPTGSQGAASSLSDWPVVLPFHGPLIKLTTITEDRGPITTDTSAKGSSESTGAATSTMAAKADTEKDSKPSLGLPVLGLVLGGLAVLAILTRGIWLGPLVALAKRLLSGGVQ